MSSRELRDNLRSLNEHFLDDLIDDAWLTTNIKRYHSSWGGGFPMVFKLVWRFCNYRIVSIVWKTEVLRRCNDRFYYKSFEKFYPSYVNKYDNFWIIFIKFILCRFPDFFFSNTQKTSFCPPLMANFFKFKTFWHKIFLEIRLEYTSYSLFPPEYLRY